MEIINVLVNAYAVSPNWGSEQGMGWNWIVNLAKYVHLDVITEGEWKKEIEDVLKALPQKDNITFHYLPVSDKIRKMCWNQGDWRFYWYYKKWQRRAFEKAKVICANKHIDIIHQLNMIGFREPGYLWKIKGIPFVWGPVGGMESMPLTYLSGIQLKQRLFNKLKNSLNRIQYKHAPRVRAAIESSSAIISAVKGVQDVIKETYGRESILINETGVEPSGLIRKEHNDSSKPLKIIWVGKFDFRKQLPIAIRAIIATSLRNIEFHICGTGSDKTIDDMKDMVEVGGIMEHTYWHGNVPNNEVRKMMAESDLLFFTSIMEATSTVVLEAISVGLPVLCFNTCGFGPIVKDFAGVAIELTDPNKSVQDFATEITKIYHNRNILNDISKTIISRRDILTYDSKVKRIIELYNSILK